MWASGPVRVGQTADAWRNREKVSRSPTSFPNTGAKRADSGLAARPSCNPLAAIVVHSRRAWSACPVGQVWTASGRRPGAVALSDAPPARLLSHGTRVLRSGLAGEI